MKTRCTNYLDFKDYLEDLYRELKALKPRFSYNVFSQSIGLGASNVAYLIIKGKRPLTEKNADKISRHLGFSKIEHQYWTALVRYQNETDALNKEDTLRKLVKIKAKTYSKAEKTGIERFFSDWWHAVIFELIKLPDFIPEVKWINERLQNPLKSRDITASIQLLTELNLISTDSSGRISTCQEDISSGDEVESLSIIRFHHKFMDLAKASIADTSEELREIDSLTLSISRADLGEYKKELRSFVKKINRMAKKKAHQNEIYQLNLQFFPLTKKRGKRK